VWQALARSIAHAVARAKQLGMRDSAS